MTTAQDIKHKPHLISVDMGIRTGIAIFNKAGELLTMRSGNFGSKHGLKSAAYNILNEFPTLEVLAIEGGGPISEIWKKEGERRKLHTLQYQAETWRKALLYNRQHQSGEQAKEVAIKKAMDIIRDSEHIRTPKSISNDLAEAILSGIYAFSLLREK